MNTHNYRLLVVDDDEANLDMLARRLQRSGYQVTPANGGQAAMAALAQQHHHLIVLDIMMPQVDGFAVLKYIRERDDLAEAPVIMLTATSEREDVIRCLKLGANDYVVKPFNLTALCERIDKYLVPEAEATVQSDTTQSMTAPNLVKELAESLKTGTLEFPILPAVGLKVAEIARSDSADLSEITRVISLDPGLATKLLSLSNSSLYRGQGRFTKVEDAVARIGLKETASQALLLTTSGMYKSDNPLFERLLAELWTHSLATGVLSKLISMQTRHGDPHQLFTMGLLHDIGQLVLLKVLMELERKRPMSSEQAIHEVLDVLHGDFGAAILKRWKFPSIFIDLARSHHADDLAELAPDIAIVVIANKLALYLPEGAPPLSADALAGLSAAGQLGLSGEILESVVTAGRIELQKALSGLSECGD